MPSAEQQPAPTQAVPGDATAPPGHALLNPFGTLGVVQQPQPVLHQHAAEPGAAPAILALVAGLAAFVRLLRWALE